MKTLNLTGAALDWAVAKCMGLPIKLDPMGFGTTENGGYWIWYDFLSSEKSLIIGRDYSPSTNWAQGGPIIAHMFSEGLEMSQGRPLSGNTRAWARLPDQIVYSYGSTPLEAAMRCYVASKLGDEVEIPDELAN